MNLKDHQTIPKKFLVKFGVEGMTVHPAGAIVEGTGHHHLIIDGGSLDHGTIVPADEKHIHFGKGQTEYEVTLSRGKHELTLQFADGMHESYGKEMSETVHVIVR